MPNHLEQHDVWLLPVPGSTGDQSGMRHKLLRLKLHVLSPLNPLSWPRSNPKPTISGFLRHDKMCCICLTRVSCL